MDRQPDEAARSLDPGGQPAAPPRHGSALSQARTERAGVRAAIARVESALASPTTGRDRAWRGELADQLATLEGAFARHVAATEGPDGLLAEIVAGSPRLARRVEEIASDHGAIAEELGAARTALLDAPPNLEDVRDRVVAVLIHLVRHRQRGADLVYEAFQVDIEGGG